MDKPGFDFAIIDGENAHFVLRTPDHPGRGKKANIEFQIDLEKLVDMDINYTILLDFDGQGRLLSIEAFEN